MIDDLDVVRRLGAGDDEPDAAARTRVRERVLGASAGSRPPRRPRWRRMVGVAVPAAALAGGAALVVALGGTPAGEEPDARLGSGVPGGSAPSDTATPDLFPAPDEFLYVRSRVQHLVCSEGAGQAACRLPAARTREVWLSERAAGRLRETPGRRGMPARLGRATLYLGNRRFTHTELARYAPTPEQLLADLRADAVPGQGGGLASYPFVQLTDALREAPMPAPVRRAIVGALPLVPGVTALGERTDTRGRRGLGYARTVEGRREEVLVDPVTATMLEERTYVASPRGVPGPGFEVGERIGHAVYLERAIVDRAGRRP